MKGEKITRLLTQEHYLIMIMWFGLRFTSEYSVM